MNKQQKLQQQKEKIEKEIEKELSILNKKQVPPQPPSYQAQPTPTPEPEPKRIVPVNFKKKLGRWQKIVLWWDERRNPHKIVIINLELANGFHRTFYVKEEKTGFRYLNKNYVFDIDARYYNLDLSYWCYDFHEEFTLPIKQEVPEGYRYDKNNEIYFPLTRRFPIQAIKKALENSNITEIEYATNPSVLQRFITSEIAEGIMKGAAINDFLRQMRVWIIITLITVLLHFLTFIIKSGMLKSIKIPGVN